MHWSGCPFGFLLATKVSNRVRKDVFSGSSSFSTKLIFSMSVLSTENWDLEDFSKSGALLGAASGITGGFTSGIGNSLNNGANFTLK